MHNMGMPLDLLDLISSFANRYATSVFLRDSICFHISTNGDYSLVINEANEAYFLCTLIQAN